MSSSIPQGAPKKVDLSSSESIIDLVAKCKTDGAEKTVSFKGHNVRKAAFSTAMKALGQLFLNVFGRDTGKLRPDSDVSQPKMDRKTAEKLLVGRVKFGLEIALGKREKQLDKLSMLYAIAVGQEEGEERYVLIDIRMQQAVSKKFNKDWADVKDHPIDQAWKGAKKVVNLALSPFQKKKEGVDNVASAAQDVIFMPEDKKKFEAEIELSTIVFAKFEKGIDARDTIEKEIKEIHMKLRALEGNNLGVQVEKFNLSAQKLNLEMQLKTLPQVS